MARSSSSSTKRRAAADDGKVTLVLAHPISTGYQAGLGLDVKPDSEDYAVNEEVHLYPHVARAVINAGYAQVDPEDPEAIADALNISTEAAEAVAAQMAGDNPVRPVVDES